MFGLRKKWRELSAPSALTDRQIWEAEIRRFKLSPERRLMLAGERYYAGEHDILARRRTVIGPDGALSEVHNLPNNRIVDNQYRKLVEQKCNYLLGQPLVLRTENREYASYLQALFGRRFQRLLRQIGMDALNEGLGWLYIYCGDDGELRFRRFKPYEIIPGWADAEHSELEYAIRLYEVIEYEGSREQVRERVEVYSSQGIEYFELANGSLLPTAPYRRNYLTYEVDGEPLEFNWARLPLIPFKYNGKEIPLIKMVKSLQDGLNLIESNFQNQMEEDARNTILVLVNYDGENLGEFRQNLASYGAVKVRNDSLAGGGDVRTLQVEVNAENYREIISLFKKAIIENAMGYDAKDERLAGSPNQMNIQSMYSDIDLDANGMETEFQAAFEDVLWFVSCYLANLGRGDFAAEPVEVIFNRDILINESDAIDNCVKSLGLLSTATVIAQHPWVDDPAAELERRRTEQGA